MARTKIRIMTAETRCFVFLLFMRNMVILSS